MSRFRPMNLAAVTAHDHEETLSDRRRAVVTSAQLTIIDLIAKPGDQLLRLLAVRLNGKKFTYLSQCWVIRRDPRRQHADECLESLTCAGRIRAQLNSLRRTNKFIQEAICVTDKRHFT